MSHVTSARTVLKLHLPTKLPLPELGWLNGSGGRGSVPTNTGLSTRPCPLPSTPAPRKSARPGISTEKRAATAAAVATVGTSPTPLNPKLHFLSQLPHTQQPPDGDRWCWAREAPDRMKLPGGRNRLRCNEPTLKLNCFSPLAGLRSFPNTLRYVLRMDLVVLMVSGPKPFSPTRRQGTPFHTARLHSTPPHSTPTLPTTLLLIA